MQLQDPSQDRVALRAALGQFATGVTVVTVAAPGGPLGMTANSFTSVSLDPPLLLWCPARRSARHGAMVEAEAFALHVLSEDQAPLARAFSRQADAFHDCDWQVGPHGLPLISGCAARFVCTTHDRVAGGDHTIVLGRIVDFQLDADRSGLVFAGGGYGRFTAS